MIVDCCCFYNMNILKHLYKHYITFMITVITKIVINRSISVIKSS